MGSLRVRPLLDRGGGSNFDLIGSVGGKGGSFFFLRALSLVCLQNQYSVLRLFFAFLRWVFEEIGWTKLFVGTLK